MNCKKQVAMSVALFQIDPNSNNYVLILSGYKTRVRKSVVHLSLDYDLLMFSSN